MRTAAILLLITVGYNVAEGVVAIWSGVEAGSVALVAFGADSYLEVAAASLVLWRLRIRDHDEAERAERRSGYFIGWTFLILAAAVLFQSAVSLISGSGAEESLVGIGLALASVTFMPALSIWKLRVAASQRIPSLAAEAKETVACSYLSFTLLLGLVANYFLGWWWLDPVTAGLLVPWLVREGLEGVRGETCADDIGLCSCRSCLYGLRDCHAECCSAAA